MKTNLHQHLKSQAEIPTDVLAPVLRALRDTKVNWEVQTAKVIRDHIVDALRNEGWPKPVKLDAELGLTITAMKAGTALCVQFGNMARFYADLLKLQYLHQKNRASAAIYVLPTQDAAKKIGDNIANSERLCRELNFFREIIRIPVLVVGVED